MMTDAEFQSRALDALLLVVGGGVAWALMFVAVADAWAAFLGRGSRPMPASVLRSTWAPGDPSTMARDDERAAGCPSSSGEVAS